MGRVRVFVEADASVRNEAEPGVEGFPAGGFTRPVGRMMSGSIASWASAEGAIPRISNVRAMMAMNPYRVMIGSLFTVLSVSCVSFRQGRSGSDSRIRHLGSGGSDAAQKGQMKSRARSSHPFSVVRLSSPLPS